VNKKKSRVTGLFSCLDGVWAPKRNLKIKT
jgi:hypothetical protein